MKKIIIILLLFFLTGCSQINYVDETHVFRTNYNEILLTFDDGPNEYTPQILDILKNENVGEYNIKVAFFLIGRNAEQHPELVKRMADEGHIIGNHTYSHPDLIQTSFIAGKYEILECQRILGGYGQRKWFRPPYSGLTYELTEWLKEEGFTVIHFTIQKHTLENLQPGDIILLHDTERVVRDLPEIIQKIKEVLN